MPARNNPETSHAEIEIKLRVADRGAMLRRLAKLKAHLQVARTHEMDTLYDTADGQLRRDGQLLRIREVRPAPRGAKKPAARKSPARRKNPRNVVLTHKGPAQASRSGGKASQGDSSAGRAYKIRLEREVNVADADVMAAILAAMGLQPSFRYEKYRSTYALSQAKGLKVELDETPVGDFLELEGKPKAIDRAAALLGYGPADYITKSYGALWLEHNGISPAAAEELETPPCRRSKKRADARDIAGNVAGDMLF
jgi:adenylate cyclase class IV